MPLADFSFLPLLCPALILVRVDVFSVRVPDVFRDMRAASGRSSSSSSSPSSASLRDEEEMRRFFDGGWEASLRSEDDGDSGRLWRMFPGTTGYNQYGLVRVMAMSYLCGYSPTD